MNGFAPPIPSLTNASETGGSGVQVAESARTASTAAGAAAWESLTGWQASVAARLSDRRLEIGRADVEAFGQRVDERLVTGLSLLACGWCGGLRLG